MSSTVAVVVEMLRNNFGEWKLKITTTLPKFEETSTWMRGERIHGSVQYKV
jgi:hypothetical protein